MKKSLLIITQTVDKNDSNLGFFCGWLKEFSRQLDRVYVIANKVGDYDLPNNVIVLSLGKEKGAGRFTRMINFWKYLFRYLPDVSAVFAHMCPEYVIYGGWLARLYGKKLGLWYLHKSLTWKLKLAVVLANNVFTAHSDGLPIKSPKILITGHGIDTSVFGNIQNKLGNGVLDLLTVGRVSPSKNLLILVKSAILLRKKIDKPVCLRVVGEPYLKEDKKYLEDIKTYIKENKAEDIVEFVGKAPHSRMASYYGQADVFLNASKTGGVDKAVLEAMVSGLPVITSNFSFKNILPSDCLFEEDNVEDLIEKVLLYKNIQTDLLKGIVRKDHSLESMVSKIIIALKATN